MGRKKKPDPALMSIAQKLEVRGFNTLDRIVDLLRFDMPLSDDEAKHEYVQTLAQQDFSLMPSGDSAKPWRLILRAKVALENLGRLLQFQAPVLRSASVTSEHSERWNVVITQFSGNVAPEKILPPQERNYTLPIRSIDLPPSEPVERRPTPKKLGTRNEDLPADQDGAPPYVPPAPERRPGGSIPQDMLLDSGARA